MLTWLASLQQGTAKKFEKSMKIVTEEIYIIFWTTWGISMKFLRKMWLMIYKVTKTQCFTPYLEDAFLEKSQGGSNWPQLFLGYELSGIKSGMFELPNTLNKLN